MSIALFGTSADPPTEGHRVLLEGLLRHFPRVATWASDNPMKAHGQPLPQRTALLAALVEAIGDPRLSLEPHLSSPWAIETLQRAAARWPGEELVFVVGSDLVGQIPRWKEAAAVLRGCRLLIAPREGWPLQPAQLMALEELGARTRILDLEVPGTASSRVRQAAPHGAVDALEEVPPALRPVLLEHNLYGFTGSDPAIGDPPPAIPAGPPEASDPTPLRSPGTAPQAPPTPTTPS